MKSSVKMWDALKKGSSDPMHNRSLATNQQSCSILPTGGSSQVKLASAPQSVQGLKVLAAIQCDA